MYILSPYPQTPDIFRSARKRGPSAFHGGLASTSPAGHLARSTDAQSSQTNQSLGSCHSHGNEHTVKKSKEGYSSLQASLPSPLRELTCHMGSHSVTCHPLPVATVLPATMKPSQRQRQRKFKRETCMC